MFGKNENQIKPKLNAVKIVHTQVYTHASTRTYACKREHSCDIKLCCAVCYRFHLKHILRLSLAFAWDAWTFDSFFSFRAWNALFVLNAFEIASKQHTHAQTHRQRDRDSSTWQIKGILFFEKISELFVNCHTTFYPFRWKETIKVGWKISNVKEQQKKTTKKQKK